MQRNQSTASTKLNKHDFVFPEIEVASQLIDLRSSATLYWSVAVRPWPCRRWQIKGTVIDIVLSGVWHLDYIVIMWPSRGNRLIQIIRLKWVYLACWVSSAVDIVSGQVVPSAVWTIRRWDASICQHTDGLMRIYSSPHAAIVSTITPKRHILLASLIL